MSDQCLEIYMAYPRRTARKYALKCIAKALLDLPFEEMLVRVQQFATFCRGQDNQFIPHPSTWFNQGRYYDIEDDPDCWPAAPEIPTAEAWEIVLGCIRRYGRDTARDAMPGVVYDATREVGWGRLCDMTEYSRAELCRVFSRAYERVAASHGRSGKASARVGNESTGRDGGPRGVGERLAGD